MGAHVEPLEPQHLGPVEPVEPVEHLVWDWNGTLYGDSEAIITATCEIFAELGYPPLTAERYQSAFTHPVPLFYERLLGRAVPPEEFGRIQEAFLAAYHRHTAGCDLTPGAREALRAWAAQGCSQSLVSLSRHDRLLRVLARLDLAATFVRVDGLREDVPGHKAGILATHLAELAVDPSRTLLIGDSVDDAVAAASVGARCVLYASGQHTRSTLEAVGVPVVDTLLALPCFPGGELRSVSFPGGELRSPPRTPLSAQFLGESSALHPDPLSPT